MQESLEKAVASAWFLVDELRQANKIATATQSIILLPMIRRAQELKNDVEAFRGAYEADMLAPRSKKRSTK